MRLVARREGKLHAAEGRKQLMNLSSEPTIEWGNCRGIWQFFCK
jgi:hypothetical protein